MEVNDKQSWQLPLRLCQLGDHGAGPHLCRRAAHRNRGIAKTAELYVKLRVLARAVTLFPVSSLELSAPNSLDTPNRSKPDLSYSTPTIGVMLTRHSNAAGQPQLFLQDSPNRERRLLPPPDGLPMIMLRSSPPSWSNHAPVLTLARRFLIITQHIHKQPIPQHPEEPRV
jgi:hypothetical protein